MANNFKRLYFCRIVSMLQFGWMSLVLRVCSASR